MGTFIEEPEGIEGGRGGDEDLWFISVWPLTMLYFGSSLLIKLNNVPRFQTSHKSTPLSEDVGNWHSDRLPGLVPGHCARLLCTVAEYDCTLIACLL